MRNLAHSLSAILLFSAVCFSQAGNAPPSVRKHPYYSLHIQSALKELIAWKKAAGENHFFVEKVEDGSNDLPFVWVYWEEKSVLILWEPNRGRNKHGETDPRFDLVHSKTFLLLDKRLTPEFEGVTEGLLVINREDAERLLAKCRQGEKYVIKGAI